MIKISKIYIIFIALLASYQSILQAAPMSFKGSITSMATASKGHSYIESSYAITSKDSLGINFNENKGDSYKLKAGEFFYLRRLMRVNEINSQTNLWLFTSAGIVNVKENLKDDDYIYLSPTLQFDYETKRVFSMISHQIMRVGNENFDTTKIEGGFSFYETDYDETQPWLLLKTRKTSTVDSKIEFMPTLRFINKSLFGEVGVNLDGDPSFHLMYTF
jgi:hypothetical protein